MQKILAEVTGLSMRLAEVSAETGGRAATDNLGAAGAYLSSIVDLAELVQRADLRRHVARLMMHLRPRRFIEVGSGYTSALALAVEQPVRDVPLDLFQGLESGDFLFIDSTHVSKTGDVNHEIFTILPASAVAIPRHWRWRWSSRFGMFPWICFKVWRAVIFCSSTRPMCRKRGM